MWLQSVEDVDLVFERTRFTTCISPAFGGSGNPSIPTAAGVVQAMAAAVDFLGMGTLQGKRIAIQGVGNVGLPLIEFLLDHEPAAIIASEANLDRVNIARSLITPDRRVKLVHAEDGDDSILFEDVDILAPCAFGGVLSSDVISRLNTKIVCGAANNQLLDPNDDSAFLDKGITYVPDFVANRMGIVNCANEQVSGVA